MLPWWRLGGRVSVWAGVGVGGRVGVVGGAHSVRVDQRRDAVSAVVPAARAGSSAWIGGLSAPEVGCAGIKTRWCACKVQLMWSVDSAKPGKCKGGGGRRGSGMTGDEGPIGWARWGGYVAGGNNETPRPGGCFVCTSSLDASASSRGGGGL